MTFTRFASVTALTTTFVVFGMSPAVGAPSVVDSVAQDGEASAPAPLQVEVVVEDGEVSAPEPLPTPIPVPAPSPVAPSGARVASPHAPTQSVPSQDARSIPPSRMVPAEGPTTDVSVEELRAEAASRGGGRGTQVLPPAAVVVSSVGASDVGASTFELNSGPVDSDSALCVGSTNLLLPLGVAGGALVAGAVLLLALRRFR